MQRTPRKTQNTSSSGQSSPRDMLALPQSTMHRGLDSSSALHSQAAAFLSHESSRLAEQMSPLNSSPAFGDLSTFPVRQHHMSFQGAGRFWKPPDENEPKKRLFKRRQPSQSTVRSESHDSSFLAGPPPSPFAPSSPSPPSCSSGRLSDSVETESTLSEPSYTDAPQASNDAIVKPASDAIYSDTVLPIRRSTSSARRIANEERQKKTVRHLKWLYEQEEARIALIRAGEEASGSQASDGTKSPPEQTSKLDDNKSLDDLRIELDIPDHTSWNLHNLFGDLVAEPARELEDPTSGSSRDPGQTPQSQSSSSIITTTVPELPAPNTGSPAIVVRAPTKRSSHAPNQEPLLLSENDAPRIPQAQYRHATPSPVPTKEQYSPSRSLLQTSSHHGTEEGVDSQDEGQEVGYEGGLCLAQTVELRIVKPVTRDLGQVDTGLSPSSPRQLEQRLPTSAPPFLEKTTTSLAAKEASESLFAGLNQLRRSLPSRNTKPELLDRRRLTTTSVPAGHPPSKTLLEQLGSRRASTQHSLASEARAARSTTRDERLFELSASPSVVRRPKSNQQHSPLPSPHESHRSTDWSIYNTLPTEPFPMPLRVPSIEPRKGEEAEAEAKGEEGEDESTEEEDGVLSRPKLTIRDIEPDIDPRTGQRYVNRSRGTVWAT